VCVVTIDPHKGEPVGETLVIQHGVVFEEESAHVLEAATKAVDLELADLSHSRFTDLPAVQRHVTQALGRFWKQEVGRRPVILPVVLEA
jgi:ribonuclease J